MHGDWGYCSSVYVVYRFSRDPSFRKAIGDKDQYLILMHYIRFKFLHKLWIGYIKKHVDEQFLYKIVKHTFGAGGVFFAIVF